MAAEGGGGSPGTTAGPIAFFLRGVNVGGSKPMKSTVFAGELAAHDVVSIGAAGTFVARQPSDDRRLKRDIEAALPHATEVAYLTTGELERLFEPHGAEWDAPAVGTKRFVSLLTGEPVRRPRLPIFEPAKDGWVLQLLATVGSGVLSLRRLGTLQGVHYPNPAVELAFGIPATTRGWETLIKVAEIAHIPGPRPTQ